MRPLLSRLADGEATAEDMAAMRPHLRSCLTCRATLREFRAAPARVAAFAPLLVAPGFLHRVGRWVQHLGFHKTAAVVAITASVAGGGAAVVHGVEHGHRPPTLPHHRHHPHPKPHPKPEPRPPAPRAHIAGPRKSATAAHKRGHVKRASAPATSTWPAPVKAAAPPAIPHAAASPPATSSTSGEFGP
jgi:hypothetical protein